MRSGGADDAHREAPFEAVHALNADRLLAAVRPAQLARDPAVLVHVDVLARQRRPPAVQAAGFARIQAVQRSPPQLALEGVGIAEEGHAGGFVTPVANPANGPRTRPFEWV